MKKLLILLTFVLLISCEQKQEIDFVLLAQTNTENYLIIVNNDSFITIPYDSREIDKDKLNKILNITPNMEISIDDTLKDNIINIIEKYRENESCLAQIYINNKKQLDEQLKQIISEEGNFDITNFINLISKQKAYCFDNIEEIKDSANNLALWLNQVKALSRRKDL
ncbi:MAG: hypothetical protein EOL97_00925 [Spirochaetia bacterium]|nr:hypothetical protein [Spirochaetia bacterium]